jgi:hypothetical protein
MASMDDGHRAARQAEVGHTVGECRRGVAATRRRHRQRETPLDAVPALVGGQVLVAGHQVRSCQILAVRRRTVEA